MPNDHDREQIFPRPLSGRPVARLPGGLVPARTSLEGQVAILEPLDPAQHGAALYEASHGSEEALRIWDYLREGPWPSEAAYMDALRSQAAAFDHIFYAVRHRRTGRICGQASYLDIHPQDGVIEIGTIWFAPVLQRSRAATEALFLLLCYAMDDLGYRRMQWRCNSLNARSRAAARRLGFRFEGIFHNHMIYKGKNRDTAWYSILDDEWPEVRTKIATWLDDGNFNADERARNALGKMMRERQPSRRET